MPAADAYCGACGQKRLHGRLSMHEIGHDLLHAVAHVDRSALSLVGQLIVRPGRVAREYAEGRRRKHFGPFAFLVVVVALGAAVDALTGFSVVWSNSPNAVGAFLEHHVNLVYFIQVPVLAAFARLLFARDGANYAEHLVLAAYAGSLHVLYFTFIAAPLWWAVSPGPALARALYVINLPVWPLYFGFASSQFLPQRRALAACKGVAAVLLSQVAIQGTVSALTLVLARPAGA